MSKLFAFDGVILSAVRLANELRRPTTTTPSIPRTRINARTKKTAFVCFLFIWSPFVSRSKDHQREREGHIRQEMERNLELVTLL